MQLSVKGKQIDVGDALRQHVESHLGAIVAKFFSHSIDANVVFSRDAHHLFRADISVHAGRGIVVQCNSEASDPYVAFDAAADRIGKRLRRYKSRLKEHHASKAEIGEVLAASQYVINPEKADNEEPPHNDHSSLVVAEMATTIDSLTVSEAVMRLDLGDLPALMFKNRGHGGLNMVFRRADGHVGWVDPANASVAGASVGGKA